MLSETIMFIVDLMDFVIINQPKSMSKNKILYFNTDLFIQDQSNKPAYKFAL